MKRSLVMPRSPFASLPAWSFYALGLAPMLVLLALMPVVKLDDRLALALTGGSAVWAIAMVTLYWRRLDEASREAQRSAMLWGGFYGLLAAMAGGVAIAFSPAASSWIADTTTKLSDGGGAPATTHAFLIGIAFAAVCTVIGFSIAWAIWWAKRR
jgi:hypothetical protein